MALRLDGVHSRHRDGVHSGWQNMPCWETRLIVDRHEILLVSNRAIGAREVTRQLVKGCTGGVSLVFVSRCLIIAITAFRALILWHEVYPSATAGPVSCWP